VRPHAGIILAAHLSDLVSVFASDLLPIFAIAGIGFALARWLKASATTLTHVVFYALLPCLAFRLLVDTVATGRQFGRMVLLAVLVMIVMAMIGALLSVVLRLSRTDASAFLLVVMFSNGGNYGLPVVSFAFGEEALSYGAVFFLTGSVLINTVGAFLAAAGRRNVRSALTSVLRIPAIYGIAAAMLVLATGSTVPIALLRPITMLSDAALPLMILVLGMQLERAASPKRPALVAVAVCVSLLVAPLVALGFTSLFGVSGAARQAVVVLSSMPVAVVTTILALEFDASPDFVTSAVFLSTVLSPLTLTPLIAYLR
jgi:malate permease and related proteins